MKFTNYLKSGSFLKIEKEDLSSVLAEEIATALDEELIIANNKIYKRDDTFLYEEIGMAKSETLIGIVVQYLTKSYQKLTDQEKNNLSLNLMKLYPETTTKKVLNGFKKKLNESYVKANINTIKHSLTKTNITFDYDMNGIHFLNGRFNLQTNKMEPRKKGQYITKFINRNYEKPKKGSVKKIREIIGKLFREEEAQSYIMRLLGSVLSGDSVQLQRFLINYGKGSAGKSSLLNIIHSSLGDAYFKYLQNDGLSKKNQKKDKVLNSFNPAVRFYIINEVDTSTIDTNLIKQIAEGCIQTTKLYQDGSHTIHVRGTLIFISNHMLTFPPDTGINRRLVGYEYKNKFTDEENEINNETIFKKDEDIFKGNFTEDEKNAIFYIFAKECFKHLQNKKIEKPECMKEVEADLVDANDYWKKFINDHFTIKKGGRISLDEVQKIIRDSEPSKRNIQRTQIISEFKDRGIEYNRQLRIDGSRGVFLGYQWKDDSTTDPEFLDDESTDYKSKYLELLEEMKILKQQIKNDV